MLAAGDLLRVTAEFILDYRVDESLTGIPDEAATAFGKMNGIHNIWPYWREYVQSTSMRAGFPPIAIPLMTVGSMLAHYARRKRRRNSRPQVAIQFDDTLKFLLCLGWSLIPGFRKTVRVLVA